MSPGRIVFADIQAQRARIREKLDHAIERVLDHGQFIMGPEVGELEGRLAAFCGARHAITCSSGTDALLIAMMAKGVAPGQAVLCPGFTYPATPETVALLGATPVFIDVRADTCNLDVGTIAAGVALARREGLRPVGIIAVDLFGQPADYGAIGKIAREHGLWVVADAAQSFGATWRASRVGTLAEITATSFFPAKPLGCYGDGGALFTDDDTLADAMRSMRAHGQGNDKYDIARLGINGRLDTIQAAVLIEKLAIFPDEIEAREAVARRYTRALGKHLGTPAVPAGATSVWAQYTVRLARRDEVAGRLAADGIPTAVHYPRPLHHQPAYRDYPVAGGALPVSESLAARVLSLPVHAYLSEVDQDRIIDAMLSAVRAL